MRLLQAGDGSSARPDARRLPRRSVSSTYAGRGGAASPRDCARRCRSPAHARLILHETDDGRGPKRESRLALRPTTRSRGSRRRSCSRRRGIRRRKGRAAGRDPTMNGRWPPIRCSPTSAFSRIIRSWQMPALAGEGKCRATAAPRLYYALGRALDDIGDHEAAFAHSRRPTEAPSSIMTKPMRWPSSTRSWPCSTGRSSSAGG